MTVHVWWFFFLRQILAEEKGRVDSMAEGLEEESKKALQMEAELERMAAQCSHEQRQFRSQLESRDKRCQALEAELEKVRSEAESLHKQLAEAHQVAMFQAGFQQSHGVAGAGSGGSSSATAVSSNPYHTTPTRSLGSSGLSVVGRASPPTMASKPAVIPSGPQMPQKTLSGLN
jgi:hypothetical protein